VKIIFSRKGFDSTPAAGGAPSPIYEDGSLVSLPIPEPKPSSHSLSYSDIDAGGVSLGSIVEDLTSGRIARTGYAHLDPDLRFHARQRLARWKPLFGQAGAAQGHLSRQGVAPGDLFLFFGWFRDAANKGGEHAFREDAHDRHVLFGWLQVGSIHDISNGSAPPEWAAAHPHASGLYSSPNVMYVARDTLELSCARSTLPGGGAFWQLSPELVLTACDGEGVPQLRRSRWRLPRCFLPDAGSGLSFHSKPSRWQVDPADRDSVLLDIVARGQEFVFDTALSPAVCAWAADLIARNGAPSPACCGRRVLLMARELHRLGFERLRIGPGLSASGTAWRVDITAAGGSRRDKAAAHYSTRQGISFFGWDDAATDSPAQLAGKFLERFPALADAGRGADPSYASWYERMIEATAPTGLPYAYWDGVENSGSAVPHLKTTAGGPVVAPPDGGTGTDRT
jgi:hypothetical protein